MYFAAGGLSRIMTVIAVGASLAGAVWAAPADTRSGQAQVSAKSAATLAKKVDDDKATDVSKKADEFTNLGFGAGVGLNVDGWDDVRVAEAEIIDGILRVKKDEDVKVGLMIETHKFLVVHREKLLKSDAAELSGALRPQAAGLLQTGSVSNEKDWTGAKSIPLIASGPFASITTGSDNLIQSFVLGWMWGFRDDEADDSWNLGIGLSVDPNARVLGDGLVINGEVPDGTEVRFRETNQTGLAIVLSRGW